ncbi:patatin-like phospholipase family protein [Nocardia sp. NPDC051929]|uniref:patatin-like phospholipase family protein n=1 Tax=unclassified Nocardia TaxID=2637762 RepID=UPI0034471A69
MDSNCRRALVLGGGGLTGTGWLVGMLYGLAEAGVDLSQPDVVIGTSSGAIVGALITTGADLEHLYARYLSPLHPEPVRELNAAALASLGSMMAGEANPQLARARVGHAALAAAQTASADDVSDSVAARIPASDWPEHPTLLLTAVDANSGEFVALRRQDGVPLQTAVAASCALPFAYRPVEALGRRWIDGFLRSPANADLAADCDRVVVLAPMPEGFGPGKVVDQAADLAATTGASVVTVVAERVPENPLDPSQLATTAKAGHDEAAAAAAEVSRIWFGC